jgi:hypothetical protein
MGGHRRSEAYLLAPVGRELVRSALVVKLAAETDDEGLMLRAAGRVLELAALVLAGQVGPVPVEGPGYGELLHRAFPGRSHVDEAGAEPVESSGVEAA